MKRITPSLILLLSIVFASSIISCDSDDTLNTDESETSLANLESFAVLPGMNRVQIKGSIPAGASITEVQIKWSPNDGSMSIDIPQTSENFEFMRTMENLTEDFYNFEVQTIDASGKTSPVLAGGTQVYGESYADKIYNRTLVSKILSDEKLVVNYNKLNSDLGALGTEITYEDTDGITQEVFISATQTTVTLPEYKKGTDINYRSLYKPSQAAIDTIYTSSSSFQPIPFPVLQNAAVPFEATSSSGRWGTLAVWTSNEAVKNHGGYGGWDQKYNNIFNVESGWGAPAVTNGKIYQMVIADAGSYALEVKILYTNYSNADEGGTYFVITKGEGIPDVENLDTAPEVVAYQRVDKATLNYSVPFTLEEESDITVGFLTSQSDAGRYGQISSFTIVPGS